MSRSLAIFLLTCLGIPFVGTYSWLLFQKHQIKEAVKTHLISSIDRNELVTLSFSVQESLSELHWEHDREFEYKGQMYDIVEIKTRNDSVYYVCWWDHAETALNTRLHQFVEKTLGKDPMRQGKKEQLKDFYKNIYWERVALNSPPLNDLSGLHNKRPYFFIQPSYKLFAHAPESPPPEEVL